MRLAWLLLGLSGCQCLVPVDERPDGGVTTDGGQAECDAPTDCTGAFTTISWCFGDGGVDWSCVDHRCVPQCPGHGAQTCETEAPSHCLKCPASSMCVEPDCTSLRTTRWHLEQVSCERSPFRPDDVLLQTSDDGCPVPLLLERDGGTSDFGHLYLQPNSYELSARIDALGGTCLVSGLPTGLERVLFECPRCQFVVVNLGP